MKTTIDGVSITLTDDQVKYIQEVKADRRNKLNTFEKVLIYFGFTKYGIWDELKVYENKQKCWRADVLPYYVYVTGKGLRDNLPSLSRHCYYNLDELIEELESKI